MPALNPTYSQAIKANGFVFVSGQIGLDPATSKLASSDIAEQARQAIENTATILKAAGSSLDNAAGGEDGGKPIRCRSYRQVTCDK